MIRIETNGRDGAQARWQYINGEYESPFIYHTPGAARRAGLDDMNMAAEGDDG